MDLSLSSKARYEELNMEYVRNSMGPVGKCLSDNRIDERNVHDVVLVDGSTRAQRHVRLQLTRNQGPNSVWKPVATGNVLPSG